MPNLITVIRNCTEYHIHLNIVCCGKCTLTMVKYLLVAFKLSLIVSEIYENIVFLITT